MSAISNMPVKERKFLKQKGLWYNEFEVTPKMSSYLVVFVICNFSYKDTIASTLKPVKVGFVKFIVTLKGWHLFPLSTRNYFSWF